MPLGAVIDTCNALGIDFLAMGGDWSEQLFEANSNANEDSLVALMARSSFPWVPIEGNWEALPSDTTASGDPYDSARTRFSSYFGAGDWHSYDHKNVRLIALQNCANVDTTTGDDYRQNNPVNTPGYKLNDYAGITEAASPQRTWLAGKLSTRNPAHWLIPAFHRPVYGSSANSSNRLNIISAARGDGFLKQIEDALATGERGLALVGDQHLPLWLTKAIADSALSAETAKGIYHLIVSSGSGARTADTTEVLGGSSLQGFLYYDNSTRSYGRTSEAWADTMTVAADPGMPYTFTWSLMTVYGDAIFVEVFRTWTTQSAGHPKYSGAGTHKRIGAYRLRRDVG